MSELYRMLAMLVDIVHALAMLLWGLGLPLLVWHRFERLSHLYTVFAALFVAFSVLSHWTLGECFLTTLARWFWLASGGWRDTVPFTVLLANAVAGIRPSARSAVLVWEAAILGFDPDGGAPARRIAATPVPTLLIHGDADTQVPLRHSQALAHAAGGRARLLVLHGGTHDSMPTDAKRVVREQSVAWFDAKLRTPSAG
jgi:fermentation-respiration switch protein FrsA (DUF1100 family)